MLLWIFLHSALPAVLPARMIRGLSPIHAPGCFMPCNVLSFSHHCGFPQCSVRWNVPSAGMFLQPARAPRRGERMLWREHWETLWKAPRAGSAGTDCQSTAPPCAPKPPRLPKQPKRGEVPTLAKQRQHGLRGLVGLRQHGRRGLHHDAVSGEIGDFLGHIGITHHRFGVG